MQKSIDENESDWYNYIVSLCYPKRSRKVVLLLKTQKALLIVNPCAGRNNKRLAPLEIVKKFSQPEWDTDIRTTRCQGDATTIVREIGAQYDVILCCGGDGTLNEVINGLMCLDRKVPVGYIPSGSTNDLASTLGIPTELGASADLIRSGRKNSYDLGTLDGKYFTYIASFGVATDLSYSTPQKLKNMFGHAAYMINGFVIRLIPMLLNFKPVHMKIEYDDGVIEDDFYFGSVSNSTSVAGLFKFKDVKLNDGYLELFMVKGLKRNVDALKMLKKAIAQDYDGVQMMIVKTKKVKITCDQDVPWTLDGEFGGTHRDCELEVVHNAFEIFSDNNELFVDNKSDIKITDAD